MTPTAGFAFRVVAHGAAAGARSRLQGDSFHRGFAVGAAMTLAGGAIHFIPNEYARIGAAAVVGGVTAEITGGDFQNGALTAAFIQMYNDEVHFELTFKAPQVLLRLIFGDEFHGIGFSVGVVGLAPGRLSDYQGEVDVGLYVQFHGGNEAGIPSAVVEGGNVAGIGSARTFDEFTQPTFEVGAHAGIIGGAAILDGVTNSLVGIELHSGLGLGGYGAKTFTYGLSVRNVQRWIEGR